MTRGSGRPRGRRLSAWACGVAAASLCALLASGVVEAAAKRKPAAKSPMSRLVKQAPAEELALTRPLSYSEEFDRAELVERMLSECRGINYNALELAQTSGEALWLPAPIQLVVVRVRHPYCAELLRTYAPKTSV